ncbi:YncE family protein [Mycobacterium botniense]|uniref:Uncharacterized protein n=1 Tax=Mycobacterium botniense TaxID=84962 RepID=A0A7I9XU86_9MYCO|nr:YncE family protein [Mycobacterium botniense]GFG73495.1 hypothetical protein MBOT_08600 [Mycobacterium botniense]
MTPAMCSQQRGRYGAESAAVSIPVSGGVVGIAVTPGGHVYAATTDGVTVIDGRDHRVITTVPIPGHPKNIVTAGDGSTVCVIGYSGLVSMICPTHHTVRTGRCAPTVDEVAAPDGSRFYLAHGPVGDASRHSRISVIDPSGTTIAAIRLPGRIASLAVSSDGARLYAATSERLPHHQYDQGSVLVIDTTTYAVVDRIPIGVCPSAMTLGPEGWRLYVTHPEIRCVSAVNLKTRQVSLIPVEDIPLRVVVSPAGCAYVITVGSVAVVDTVTNTVRTHIAGDLPRGVAADPDGRYLYVTNFGGGSVTVIDMATHSVVTTIEVGGNPEAVAVHPEGRWLYVGDYWAATVTALATPRSADTSVPRTVNLPARRETEAETLPLTGAAADSGERCENSGGHISAPEPVR